MPKVHNKPIKKDQERIQTKRAKDNRSVPWSGAPDRPVCHRTVFGAPPDSVRCTREPNSKLLTFRNSGSRSTIIHRTVRCSTAQCPVCQRSNSYYSANGRLPEHLLRYSARRSQSSAEGAPDSLQDLSGAPPDCPVAQKTEAPTIEP